jgi:hypothetical protein
VLHGIYGAGAVISPLVATSMIAKGGLPWYYFYYVGNQRRLISRSMRQRPPIRWPHIRSDLLNRGRAFGGLPWYYFYYVMVSAEFLEKRSTAI